MGGTCWAWAARQALRGHLGWKGVVTGGGAWLLEIHEDGMSFVSKTHQFGKILLNNDISTSNKDGLEIDQGLDRKVTHTHIKSPK